MKKKLLSTLLLIGTLLIGSTVSAYAQDVSSNPLQPYEDRLEELSTELGTDLAIVAPEDGTIEDAIDFYSNMSMEEFDSYVKDAYEEAESLDVVTEEYVSEESSSLDVAPLASIAYYQKYFYNSGNTNNYLYVRAYVNSDTSKYTGEVYDIGSVQKSYPSYKCKSASMQSDLQNRISVVRNLLKPSAPLLLVETAPNSGSNPRSARSSPLAHFTFYLSSTCSQVYHIRSENANIHSTILFPIFPDIASCPVFSH